MSCNDDSSYNGKISSLIFWSHLHRQLKSGLSMVSAHLSATFITRTRSGTYTFPSSVPEQMQELEQRLLEAEQRAENAETQVTLHGGLGRVLG